jgi:hypothetical protein
LGGGFCSLIVSDITPDWISRSSRPIVPFMALVTRTTQLTTLIEIREITRAYSIMAAPSSFDQKPRSRLKMVSLLEGNLEVVERRPMVSVGRIGVD